MYGVGQSSPQRRGWLVIIGGLVLVLMLAGLFYAFYTLVLKNGDEPSTVEATATLAQVADVPTDTVARPTGTATSEPATSTPRPTTLPTDTPLPTPTLRPPPQVITIGVRARVNLSEGLSLNLRNQPTLNGSTVITQLAGGAHVNVVEGPEIEGDLQWWNVEGEIQQSGWVVEALGNDLLLLPIGWVDQMPPLSAPTTPTATATLAPATPTVVLTATAASELTPTVAPTAVLTPTATPEGGVGSPTVGGRAQVTTQYQFVNLRAEPGLGTEVIGQLENGTIVSILEGPEDVNDLRWWQVEDDAGNVGWAAERVGGEVLLVPLP